MKKKATQLPKLFEAAFSKNTLLKYKSAWHKWVEWSANYAEVNHCPADPFFICLYFNDLVMTNSPISTVITAIYGIRWGHINSGFKSPTDNPIVKLAFEGAKKIIGKARVNKKEPFTAEIIKKLVSIYGDTESLMALRFLIICVVGFAGFFRINELLKLKIIDLVETKDSFEITVKESKTDQLREGHVVYIARTGTPTCPFYWIKRYLRKTGLKDEPASYFICRLAKTKRGHNTLGNHNISYDTARKTFLEHLAIIYKKPESYGLHSLRSGGASAAANNDVPSRLIGKHGRWVPNSTSQEGYIKDSKQKRLSVSKSLGI